MPGTILKLKRHRLLPAISVLTVSLLLTGEFFNCCRINVAFAVDVRQVIQTLGFITPLKAVASTSEDPDHHCHGHEVHSTSQIDGDAIPGLSMFTQVGSCISDQSIAKKSMVGSESFTLEIPTAATRFLEEPLVVKSFSIDHPRPQNRSSPPIYLLTLRILV